MSTFQTMILQLLDFWAKQGCALHQGYDLEVGAGTFNPTTFLRCLGPEPYKAAYVEPSRRPKDGRYGENPNRLQFYHQFQVILKPSPSNILDLYLKSLECIGFDLKKHDVRFVHDDWENPTIGASGLGWEVWIDGMEVTQFTYFQTVGGISVKPVTGEITYGLERIAMYLQKVDSLFDLRWNDELLYGDIFKRNEWEWSHYNFNEANVAMWFKHFEEFENEAKVLMAKKLPIPAYDFVMKASHAFNILDARGVISVTERTGYITRIRNLAKMIAEAYIKSREEQGYPLIKRFAHQEKAATVAAHLPKKFDPQKEDLLLLEIGSEELPASFVPIGVANLEKEMRKLLAQLQLNFGSIEVFGTPRRLSIRIHDLAEGTLAQSSEKRGPPVTTAFDNQGQPTQAGMGFFRSVAQPPLSLDLIRQGQKGLEIRLQNGIEYLFAIIETAGRSTIEMLAEAFPQLILSIDFPKKMHWGNFDIEYPRPILWIAALYGSHIIPFTLANIASNDFSYGHPLLKPGVFKIEHPRSYVDNLKQHRVMVDIQERRSSIDKQLDDIEKQENGTIVAREKVMQQVLHLVEWPMLTVANFNDSFLQAPKEVLISEMVEHQKYFPIAHIDGSLQAKFIITANNEPSDQIRSGNQKALFPRLADGVFLYQEDLKQTLASFNEKLKSVTFQKDLGTVYGKVERISQIASYLQSQLKIGDATKIARAAQLSKADLATLLVGEFPELQGIAGKIYAQQQNEDPDVAIAIDEQWMPRGEKAPLPKTATGIVLSFADKFDNLLSCFALDMQPTSSSDPYALRRQALGIIKVLIENQYSLALRPVLEYSLRSLLKHHELRSTLIKEIEAKTHQILQDVENFFATRLKSVLIEMGYQKDEIEAVLAFGLHDIYDSYRQVIALHQFRKRKEAFQGLLEVYVRSKKILLSQNPKLLSQRMLNTKSISATSIGRFPEVLPTLLDDAAEKELYSYLVNLKTQVTANRKDNNFEQAYLMLSEIKPVVDAFFERVKVVDNDQAIKNNRLGLLQTLFDLCDELGDLGKIQEHK